MFPSGPDIHLQVAVFRLSLCLSAGKVTEFPKGLQKQGEGSFTRLVCIQQFDPLPTLKQKNREFNPSFKESKNLPRDSQPSKTETPPWQKENLCQASKGIKGLTQELIRLSRTPTVFLALCSAL